MNVQFSKKDWVDVGTKAGWFKKSMAIEVPGETEEALSKYDIRYVQEALKDFQIIQSYQPKVNNALQRYTTIVESAQTPEEMLRLISDITSLLGGLRNLYVSFYNGLKDLRQKSSLVELSPVIQSLYKIVSEIYDVEEDYKTWNDLTNASEEDVANFVSGSKHLPEVIKSRNDAILSVVNAAQEQLSKLIPKEEPKPEPKPEPVPATLPAPAPKVEEPESPKIESPDLKIGQIYRNVKQGITFKIKEINVEKNELTLSSDEGTYDPVDVNKFKKAVVSGKIVLVQ